MSAFTNAPRKPRRPRCLTKFDLVSYFKVSYRVLWSRILPDELLEGWGYSYEKDLKRSRTFDPILSAHIYRHYNITNLDAEELPQAEEMAIGERAPEDI
ncbi:hypothetical protein [Neolewinella agarilytica]|uniref:hypothetical protein n=1 Tax=Neolewinella agarilytica TaxID=478744 RepID=UPI0011144DB9|nr:hypothetical protein [Neolewinella agarilytica]